MVRLYDDWSDGWDVDDDAIEFIDDFYEDWDSETWNNDVYEPDDSLASSESNDEDRGPLTRLASKLGTLLGVCEGRSKTAAGGGGNVRHLG